MITIGEMLGAGAPRGIANESRSLPFALRGFTQRSIERALLDGQILDVGEAVVVFAATSPISRRNLAILRLSGDRCVKVALGGVSGLEEDVRVITWLSAATLDVIGDQDPLIGSNGRLYYHQGAFFLVISDDPPELTEYFIRQAARENPICRAVLACASR